jgi:hypothetical protein
MPTAAELKAMIKVIKPKVAEVEPVKKVRKGRVSKDVKELSLKHEDVEKIPKAKRTVTRRSDYEGNGHWAFDSPMGGKGKFGFIYVIHDLINDKYYLGKKQYRGTGQENFGVASNWPWYTSSRDTLVELIKARGKEHFEFIVLEEYSSNKALGYAETWSLMRAETPSNQGKWYNRLVNKVSWFCSEAITQRHKDRLDAIIKGEVIITKVNI